MHRSFAFLVALSFGPLALVQAASAAPHASHAGASVAIAGDDDKDDAKTHPGPAKNAGTIDGQVTAIDYRASTMTVVAGARHVDVTVLPSTNIQGPGNGFHTIADIQKGAHVRVLLSERAGTFSAQIITLR